jgi:TonB family protein
MRKIGFLVSIALHIGLIYLFFNIRIPVANLQIRPDITDVKLVLPAEIVFYDTKKIPRTDPEIIFTDPRTGKILPAPGLTAPAAEKGKSKQEKQAEQDTGAIPALQKFSLSPAQQPLLKHKPDFLIPEGKQPLIANPFAEIRRELEPDLSKYISPYARIYGDPEVSKVFEVGADVPGGKAKQGPDVLSKGKQGRIDFNVVGLDITPWARKVVNKIQKYWFLPSNLSVVPDTSLTVGVKIVVQKSGSISSVEIQETSKVEELDRAVLYALNSSSPFPSLPEGFPRKNLVAFLHFNISDND